MKISEIISSIDNNQLFVPVFQREYVWKRENVKSHSYLKQISRDKSSAIVLKDVKFNQGVQIDD